MDFSVSIKLFADLFLNSDAYFVSCAFSILFRLNLDQFLALSVSLSVSVPFFFFFFLAWQTRLIESPLC